MGKEIQKPVPDQFDDLSIKSIQSILPQALEVIRNRAASASRRALEETPQDHEPLGDEHALLEAERKADATAVDLAAERFDLEKDMKVIGGFEEYPEELEPEKDDPNL